MKNKQIVASVSGLILMVVLVITSIFWAYGQIATSAAARKHTFIVLNQAGDFMSALKDAETGQRGYLLTGNETFLQTYLVVQGSIRAQLKDLLQLSSISGARKHLDTIGPLVDAEMAEMLRAITLRRNNNQSAALAVVASGQGNRLMDLIRAEMRSFTQIEESTLAQYDAEYQLNMHRLFAIIVLASVLMLLCALTFAYFIYRQSQQKLKNLIHLETVHLLEIQEETNKQLQHTNVALQESEEKLAVTLISIGDGVIATDAKARVTLLNQIAEHLTGWTQAEAIGHPIEEIFHIINKDTRLPTAIPIMEAIAHGTIQGLANHTVLIALNGSECDIADSCAPIRNRDDQVIGAVLVFRNVTEEYATQQSLRDSSALVQTILDTVVDGIITIHAQGDIIESVNQAAELMFGYTAAELTGQNIGLLIPNFVQDLHNSSLEYNDEERVHNREREVMGRRKDGSIFPMEISVSEMQLKGHRYFTGILRDITPRKQAEEALLKAGVLQSAIFNSANFSSIATDAKGIIQIFNVGAERMLGYTAAEVIDKISPAEISDPMEVIARAKTLSAELETLIAPGFEALVLKASRGVEDIYELTYIRKDGSRFPAVVSVTALRDSQAAIIGYLLIGIDNSARKKIEADQLELAQRLRDYQFYTRSLFESNIDAIMTTDPNCIITDVNKQMEVLTSSTRDELIGAPFRDYFTDPKRAEAGINRALMDKKLLNYELTACARDGKETVVSFNATTFYDRDRKLQGVFAAARDITDRKQQDKELESAKSVAEKANLAKSDFLSSMSHELRTPLGAILGFAQLLESGSPPPHPAQKRSIDQILQSGWYLLELINEILDLALIESGKLSMSLEPVSLPEIMNECEVMIESQAKKRGISVNFIHFATPLFVKADRVRVKQVLINLLSNAIKYNRDGGKVVVESTVLLKNSIRISVRDTGDGLSPEQLAQLFQPFNRLGQEENSVQGTGIGLTVSKRLIESMEGIIGVDSTVGKGSAFWIELEQTTKPQASANVSAYIEAPSVQVQGSVQLYTLLYVEDNPANLMLVEEIIARRSDIRLLSARNGISGIELARASLPDVVLMDINLPDISGLQALKILAGDPTTAHIPVVALSANAIPRDIEKGLEAGFFRYLTKPIKVNEFMDTLDVALKFAKENAALNPKNANRIESGTIRT